MARAEKAEGRGDKGNTAINLYALNPDQFKSFLDRGRDKCQRHLWSPLRQPSHASS